MIQGSGDRGGEGGEGKEELGNYGLMMNLKLGVVGQLEKIDKNII